MRCKKPHFQSSDPTKFDEYCIWLLATKKSVFFFFAEFNGLKPRLGHLLDTNCVKEVQWPALFMDIRIKWTKNMRLNMFYLFYLSVHFIIISIIF